MNKDLAQVGQCGGGRWDRPYLAIHILQPLEPQVGDYPRGAVIHWEDVHSELLRRCCHDLQGQKEHPELFVVLGRDWGPPTH